MMVSKLVRTHLLLPLRVFRVAKKRSDGDIICGSNVTNKLKQVPATANFEY